MTSKKERYRNASADPDKFNFSDSEVRMTKLSVLDEEIFRKMLVDPPDPNEALRKAAKRYRYAVKTK